MNNEQKIISEWILCMILKALLERLSLVLCVTSVIYLIFGDFLPSFHVL
ncbi:MAG: hypothetical protein QX190_11840 [Methylococcales bacterium]